MKKKRVIVKDIMQSGNMYYLSEPMGKNFHEDFIPELTTKQMLEMGVLGGKYMTNCPKEFPASWFRRAMLNPACHDPVLNYFGVSALQPLSESGFSI